LIGEPTIPCLEGRLVFLVFFTEESLTQGNIRGRESQAKEKFFRKGGR
jgi:hypothetical protein